MRSRTTTSIVSAVLAATVLAGCTLGQPNDYTLPGGTDTDGAKVTAYFDTVDNLVPNSQVLYNDVPIGTVLSISAQDCRKAARAASCSGASNWRAKVTLTVKKSVELPRNVEAKLGQKSLLGAEYIELDKPAVAKGTLQAGDVITATGNYPATEDVLSAVSLLLNHGGLSQLNTITTELNSALSGRENDARDLIDQLNTFAGSLNARRQAVVTAISATNRLAANLRQQTTTITAALKDIGPGLKSLNDERDLLTNVIGKLGRFGSTASSVINRSHEALVNNLRSLKPILAGLNDAGDDLPKVLDELTFPFPLQNVDRFIRGDFVNFFITIDATGASLFGTPGNGKPVTPVQTGTSTTTKTAPGTTTSTTPARSTPTAAPTATTTPGSPAPTQTPCNLVSQLLGGC